MIEFRLDARTVIVALRRDQQRGAILIFCLVFLVVLTVMAASSMESALLEERIAGNQQDESAAFQAAEISLRTAENWLLAQQYRPETSANGSTVVWERDAADPDLSDSLQWWQDPARDDNEWWKDNAIPAVDVVGFAEPPRYLIEELAELRTGQSIAIGSGLRSPVLVFHRVTARGTGRGETAVVQLQTTFAKLYNEGAQVIMNTRDVCREESWRLSSLSAFAFIPGPQCSYPQEMLDPIQDTLANHGGRVRHSDDLLVTQRKVRTKVNYCYRSGLDRVRWSSELLAVPIRSDGEVAALPDWNAANILKQHNFKSGRKVITFNLLAKLTGAGMPNGQGATLHWPRKYSCASEDPVFSPAQISTLLTDASLALSTADAEQIVANQTLGQAISASLRGQRSREASRYQYGVRDLVFEDVVKGQACFVLLHSFPYSMNLAPRSYATFRSHNGSRRAKIYERSKAGMLHGFDATAGLERIAYIGNAVSGNLRHFARADYSHRHHVDSPSSFLDPYRSVKRDLATGIQGRWRTSLWEFNHADEEGFSYTLGSPQIAKMANGRGAAAFGNGYNNPVAYGLASSSGRGALYGWMLELMSVLVEGVAIDCHFSELQVNNSKVRYGSVIFTRLIPPLTPSDSSGYGFVMLVGVCHGSAHGLSTLDLAADCVFDEADADAAGRMTDLDIVRSISTVSDTGRDLAAGSASSGDLADFEINTATAAPGRQSWRQLD
jgi:type IV pilus assembly protein PilX